MQTIGMKIIVSRDEVAAFMRQWPCSGLYDRSYWFEFDIDGDLIDTDVPEYSDGPAATALSQDCHEYLFNDIEPSWL